MSKAGFLPSEKKTKSGNEQKLKPVDDDEVPFSQLPEEQKELFIEVMTRSGIDASQLK